MLTEHLLQVQPNLTLQGLLCVAGMCRPHLLRVGAEGQMSEDVLGTRVVAHTQRASTQEVEAGD